MIRSLRKKFVLTAMLSILAVLALLIGGINIASYAEVVKNADLRIDALEEGVFFFGDGLGRSPKPWGEGFFGGFGERRMSEEAPFDSRYFTVTLNADGTASSVDTGRIAAFSGDEAAALAETLFAAGKSRGFRGELRYRAEFTEDGGARYFFLNCARELTAFRSFLSASLLASLVGILLFFLLILFFTRMALRPAAESYEKQKRFITDAGHEIKTPLAVIGAAAEVIELDTGETEWTRSIRHQIARLTSLTEKLVMLSRMDEERYKPETREFSLSDTVRNTAESFIPVAEGRDKRYTVDVEDGLFYTGDPDGIAQIVSLLIDNAMKYSNEGGEVRVALRRSGKGRTLTVWNTVDSIEKGSHAEFFERFYRADASRSSAGGHGIGLSVAQAIAERHKGKLTCVSEDGKSVLFTCTLY